MRIIKDKEFGGERPLFATHDLQLENVTILAGESAIKECSNFSPVKRGSKEGGVKNLYT